MNAIAKTFHNLGPASTQYEPRQDSGTLRGVDPDEKTWSLEVEPLEEERPDHSFDPEDDVFVMHMGKKMEENY